MAARVTGSAVGVAFLAALLTVCPPDRLTASFAQTLPSSRLWRPEERTLITDLSAVTAVAATRTLVYAATTGGLAIYDRGLRAWRETVSPIDGYPPTPVLAMAADPTDDTAWLGGRGFWLRYDPFGRRFEGGGIPGDVVEVVVDARDPARGAFFRAASGWYTVGRIGFAAVPARDVPPPASRLGSMSYSQLQARLPAFDAVRIRIERDDQQRPYRLTAAALAPLTNEIFVGTDGNGLFRVDPVTYGTERLARGLSGTATSAIAAWRGQICAAGDARIQSARRAITCLDDGLGAFTSYERGGVGDLPGVAVRALLVTERAVWAATDQGLVRAARRGGRLAELGRRDGLASDQVLALAPAEPGAWVGTNSGLALVADSGRAPVVLSHVEGPPVLALVAPDRDTLWAGTAAGVVGFLLPIGGAVVRPEGPAALREAIVSLAQRGDTLLGATTSRLVMRASGAWTVIDPPGRPVGTIVRVVADERRGWWVAGTQGFAYYDPQRGVWQALVSPGDVPLPVRDIAATRDHVWVATEQGVVRYERRVLVP